MGPPSPRGLLTSRPQAPSAGAGSRHQRQPDGRTNWGRPIDPHFPPNKPTAGARSSKARICTKSKRPKRASHHRPWADRCLVLVPYFLQGYQAARCDRR